MRACVCAQGFVRSTTKYWVRNEDVSTVKHHILQHVPVFQFDTNNFAGDAQLVNSVYMDNSSMELYHGRLDKKPGAIALRIRWYGSEPPKMVFFERKTHRESWKVSGGRAAPRRAVLCCEAGGRAPICSPFWLAVFLATLGHCGVVWRGVACMCVQGEESVKDRFMLPDDKVVAFMDGEYTLEMALADQVRHRATHAR